MPIKVGYHQLPKSGKQLTGASIYYSEISRLIEEKAGHDIVPVQHDLFEIINWPTSEQASYFSRFSDADVIISNIGPYAHLYHYLREKHRARFRIIRDVRTSAWAGYLFQELASSRFTRPGDMVLFPSEFCRQFFIRFFPASLSEQNTVACYPLRHFFPRDLPPLRPANHLRLGYIGHISPDKNFDQVLNVFYALHLSGERDVELHLAGPFSPDINPDSEFSSFNRLIETVQARGISASKVKYHGVLPHNEIWTFFRSIDIFVFPALASVESFGRVLLEAQHAGVSTIAAHYAAAPELLPATNLIEPEFFFDKRFNAITTFSLGRIDEKACVERIFSVPRSEMGLHSPAYDPSRWFDYVQGQRTGPALQDLSVQTKAYLAALEIDGLGDVSDPVTRLEHAFNEFRRFNNNSIVGRSLLALKGCVMDESYPARKRIHMLRLLLPSQRLGMFNAREHAWANGFRPSVRLDSTLYRRQSSAAGMTGKTRSTDLTAVV